MKGNQIQSRPQHPHSINSRLAESLRPLKGKPDEYVFHTERGEILTLYNCRHAFFSVVAAAGVGRIRIHELRPCASRKLGTVWARFAVWRITDARKTRGNQDVGRARGKAATGIEPVVEVLQTSALPLGYAADKAGNGT